MIAKVIAAVETNKEYDEKAFFEWSRKFENEWVNPVKIIIYREQSENGTEVARRIYKKYVKELVR